VIVTAQWRADALLAEFAARRLPGDQSVADGDGIVVRTEFSAELAGLADRWLRGAVKSPPPGCALGAGSLRLWAIAAGANSVPASRNSAAPAGRSGSDRPGNEARGAVGGPDPNGEAIVSAGGPGPDGGETAWAGGPDQNRSEDASPGSPADSPAAPAGFLLRLGHTDRPAYPTIGRLLDQVGIPATYVGVRAGGPAYRITGRRRLAVLRAYVGEPPPGADSWPAPGQ
jgi:hypothetical protein